MAQLTHVCMWKDRGWVRITAREAAKLHPGGTVSAYSGLFMCELCGQYVLLTDSTVQVRHFRHSSSEKSKDCPERTFGSGKIISYAKNEHDIPIKISNITYSNFELELGFVRIPNSMISPDLRIEIRLDSLFKKSFFYSRERIYNDSITYLSIGDIPSEKYSIIITGVSENIYQFWPKTVTGIDPSGTIFDAETGRRLVYDSDVIIGKKYYLLKRGYLSHYDLHVVVKEICLKKINWETWRLYEVIAKDYNEASARFFLDYHCRLTENPVTIQTVWPLFVEKPFLIKSNKRTIVVNILGNAPTTKVFPDATMYHYTTKNGNVLEIIGNNRQQLISAGRTNALQYTYFWQEKIDQTTSIPEFEVTDLHNSVILAGTYNELIKDKTIIIKSSYDGVLVVKESNIVIEKRKINSNIPMEFDNISWNLELVLYIGADQVWNASFIRKEQQYLIDEKQFVKKLQSYKGDQIDIAHTLGGMANNLKEYPIIRQWLYTCIRNKKISRKALRDLKMFLENLI